MSTYNPPAFPRRPKRSTFFSELRYQLQLNYYQYQINTALYVMSPGEKFAYNVLFVSFFVLFLSAVYYYLPSALYLSIDRLGYYFTGSSKLHVANIHGTDMLQGSREALATLVNRGKEINVSNPFAP